MTRGRRGGSNQHVLDWMHGWQDGGGGLFLQLPSAGGSGKKARDDLAGFCWYTSTLTLLLVLTRDLQRAPPRFLLCVLVFWRYALCHCFLVVGGAGPPRSPQLVIAASVGCGVIAILFGDNRGKGGLRFRLFLVKCLQGVGSRWRSAPPRRRFALVVWLAWAGTCLWIALKTRFMAVVVSCHISPLLLLWWKHSTALWHVECFFLSCAFAQQ